MYCSNCGNEVTEEMKFCGNCGSEVQQLGATGTAPNKSLNINSKALLIGGGIVAVAAAVILVFVFLGGGVNDSPQAAVEGLIKAGLNEDADLFLKVMSPESIARLEQDLRFSNDKYSDVKEALEKGFLKEMHEDMVRDGLRKFSDVTIIQPTGYEDETRVRVKIFYGNDDEKIPVEKINGKWYVSFF